MGHFALSARQTIATVYTVDKANGNAILPHVAAFIENQRKFMKPLAVIAFCALSFPIAPASADTPDGQALSLADVGAPMIIGHATPVDGALAVEVEMSSFPGVEASDPLVDIGSLTKFVTAVAVLHMVDQGVFTLQSTIFDLLEGVPEDKRHITVHDLLTHSSGLVASTGTDEEDLARDAFVERLMATPLMHPVGQEYLYANAGYSLLAAIIEVQSGSSYEAYLNDALLLPAGLSPIGYDNVYDEDRSLRTSRRVETRFRRQTIAEASWGGASPGWNLIGNGGAVTTAEGFLLLWQAFHAGEIVSRSLVDAALTPHVDEGNGESFYGYGLVVEHADDLGTIYWHDGGNDLFSAEWRHLADRDITLFTAGLDEQAFEAMESLLEQVR